MILSFKIRPAALLPPAECERLEVFPLRETPMVSKLLGVAWRHIMVDLVTFSRKQLLGQE